MPHVPKKFSWGFDPASFMTSASPIMRASLRPFYVYLIEILEVTPRMVLCGPVAVNTVSEQSHMNIDWIANKGTFLPPALTCKPCPRRLSVVMPPEEHCAASSQVGLPDRSPDVGVLQHHSVWGISCGGGEDGAGESHHAARVYSGSAVWGDECDR